MPENDNQITVNGIIKSIENKDKERDILSNFTNFITNNIGEIYNSYDIDYINKYLNDFYFYQRFIDISREKMKYDISFNLEESLCDKLLEKGLLEKAQSVSESAYNYYSHKEFNNEAISLYHRVKDHILIKNELSKIDEKIQGERLKIIEILGFFTAVISFIFGSVQIFTNIKNYNQALELLIYFAMILMSFLLTLSFIFGDWSKSNTKNILNLILIISIIFLYYTLILCK